MPIARLWPAIVVVALLGLLWWGMPWGDIARWAAAQQREFQNAMARALRAIRDGEPGALWVLCSATAAYGLVHAIGPGHGKVLLGGAAFASGATFRRLAVLTLASSLAQSATAIFLVGAVVFGARLSSADATNLAQTWLAPASLAAIAAIGGLLIWRGARLLGQKAVDHHNHHEETACGCGHSHGPSLEDVRSLGTVREALGLVASIALRPCTGALFVLVIAARFDAFWAGCLAVVSMGLGTASFNLVVAAGGALARRFALLGQGVRSGRVRRLSAVFHVLGGGFILLLSGVALMV